MGWDLCCDACAKACGKHEFKTIGVMRRWPHPCAVCGQLLRAMVEAFGGYYENGIRVGHYSAGNPVTENDVKEMRDCIAKHSRWSDT